MDIHFCDLCNESVPQSDLDGGRAFVRRGRVICASCERAMTLAEESDPHTDGPRRTVEPATGESAATATAAPATVATGGRPDSVSRAGMSEPALPPPALIPAPLEVVAPVRSSSGLVLAMVALVFAAGAAAVLNEQIRDLGMRETAAAAQLRTQNQSLRDVERSNDATQLSIASIQADLEGRFEREREGRETELASLRSQSDRLKAEQQSLEQKMSGLSQGATARTAEADRRSDELSHRLAKSEDENHALLDRITKLEQQLEQARSPLALAGGPGSTGPAGSVGAEGELGASSDPRWTALVPDLASPKAATRWEAVDQIGQSRDAESVPFLVPMLKDGDVFVRMATARVLGDIQVPAAVPALIDALEDGEAAVREAALGSLRVITGKDLRFDPLASEGDRAKKVKAWRDWWKKVEEEGGAVKG